MGHFDDESIKDERRNYIEGDGVHYLELVSYDFFDGTKDEKTGRGYKRKIGPALNFKVVDSTLFAEGDERGKMINIAKKGETEDKTKKARKIAQSEVASIVRGLLRSQGKDEVADALDAKALDELVPNVDLFTSLFVGTVIRCDSKMNGEYTNCRWFGDDRE